jgi:hypothetical protein
MSAFATDHNSTLKLGNGEKYLETLWKVLFVFCGIFMLAGIVYLYFFS